MKKYALPNSKIILIGNKCDDEKNRKVSFQEGKQICEKYNLELFIEVSAKNGFTSPNFLELAAISLYKDFELHKDDPESVSLDKKDESIMLGESEKNNMVNKCC